MPTAPLPVGAPHDWLSLGPASRLVGVDPDTLRRWADTGRIRAFATPGGHRRFSRADLERVVAARRPGRRPLASLGATPDRLSRAYARSYRADGSVPGLERFEAAARASQRAEGRRLVAVLLAYLDASRSADLVRWEGEAMSLIGTTATRLAEAGATTPEVIEIYQRARQPLLAELGALGRRRALEPTELGALFERAIGLLDRLLLHLVTTYIDAIQIHTEIPQVNFNVILPLGSSILSFVFFAFLIDQWRERRRSYQLIWAIGMLWYGLSAGTEFLGGAVGWSEPLYRIWYLIGAIWVAGWLGLGTVFLLAKTRFGFAFALSIGLAGLFTYLTSVKTPYPNSGQAPELYGLVGLVLAVAIVVMTARRDERWVWLATGAIVGGSILSLVIVFTAPLAAPGYALNPQTHIPVGTLLPGTIRLLTPFFNITGAFALTFGALYSAYVFMPKRRVIRYDLRRTWNPLTFVIGLVAVIVNFIASVPGAVLALLAGRLNTRVPATILLAIGGFIPAITSGANRFGATSGFFVGEFLGVLFLFSGFLVSVEVFREIRVPFTHVVLRSRTAEA